MEMIKKIIIISLAFLLMYTTAYFLNVERNYPGSVIIDNENERLPHSPGYKWNGEISKKLFSLIHSLDRMIRSGYWGPTLYKSREIWKLEPADTGQSM